MYFLFYFCSVFYYQQRNKFIRKPLGANRSAGTVVVAPETEYRNNLSHLMDTEAERNRLLARNGFAASEWRSDASTPSAKRILSAQGQRKDGGQYHQNVWICDHRYWCDL